MPSYAVKTPHAVYEVLVRRGALSLLPDAIPPRAGKVFVITAEDVWSRHGNRIRDALGERAHTLFFPGGEERKRMAEVESLAEQMVALGADRTSLVVAFGGGIVGDLAGFLAAIFMRGIPVIQVPTTLLAQVDAAIGGKTGANLPSGKNLVGAFHQPLAVIVDPEVLSTLPARDYRAGLYEVIKYGVIASPPLFERMAGSAADVLARQPDIVEEIIAESVRIKAEVVSADERESGLRRILNFGHTIGHALEAETRYTRLLHGEAVAFGMRAATHLARLSGYLDQPSARRILACIDAYGELPELDDIQPRNLVRRLASDKKTIHGSVHFVLPEAIGKVTVVAGLDESMVEEATAIALAGRVVR
jgi:3-dehydroquinate synthase